MDNPRMNVEQQLLWLKENIMPNIEYQQPETRLSQKNISRNI